MWPRRDRPCGAGANLPISSARPGLCRVGVASDKSSTLCAVFGGVDADCWTMVPFRPSIVLCFRLRCDRLAADLDKECCKPCTTTAID